MHKPKILEAKQLSDGALAVRVRCCDDEKTDSWHTLHISDMTDENIQKEIGDHADRVSSSHMNMRRVKDLVNKIIASSAEGII